MALRKRQKKFRRDIVVAGKAGTVHDMDAVGSVQTESLQLLVFRREGACI